MATIAGHLHGDRLPARQDLRGEWIRRVRFRDTTALWEVDEEVALEVLAWDFEMCRDHRNNIPHQCGDHIHRRQCNTSDCLLSTALNSLNLSCNIAKVRICRSITTIVRSSSNMR